MYYYVLWAIATLGEFQLLEEFVSTVGNRLPETLTEVCRVVAAYDPQPTRDSAASLQQMVESRGRQFHGSMLVWAATYNNAPAVRYLMARTQSWRDNGYYPLAALEIATAHADLEVFDLLRPMVATYSPSDVSLELIPAAARHGNRDLLRLLLEAAPDDVRARAGHLAIYRAAEAGHADMVDSLGAPAAAEEDELDDPLWAAIGSPSAQIAKHLPISECSHDFVLWQPDRVRNSCRLASTRLVMRRLGIAPRLRPSRLGELSHVERWRRSLESATDSSQDGVLRWWLYHINVANGGRDGASAFAP